MTLNRDSEQAIHGTVRGGKRNFTPWQSGLSNVRIWLRFTTCALNKMAFLQIRNGGEAATVKNQSDEGERGAEGNPQI